MSSEEAGRNAYNALILNKITDGVEVPHSSSLCPKQQMTIEFWAYANAVKRNPMFVSKTNADWSCGYGVLGRRDGNVTMFHSGLLDDPMVEIAPQAIQAEKWTHLCFVFGDRRLEIYVNGALKAQTELSQRQNIDYGRTSEDEEAPLRIGFQRWNVSKFGFEGMIAELRIWAAEKRAQDIPQLMQGLPLCSKARRDLVLHMRFDPDDCADGGVVVDSSGHGNHGTLVGGARVARVAPPPFAPFSPSFTLAALCLVKLAGGKRHAREDAQQQQQQQKVIPMRSGGSKKRRIIGVSDFEEVPERTTLGCSIKALTFRLSGAAPLDKDLQEEFVLSNKGVSKVLVQLPKEVSTHAYDLRFEPASFTIRVGSCVTVKATIRMLCTTSVRVSIGLALFTTPQKMSRGGILFKRHTDSDAQQQQQQQQQQSSSMASWEDDASLPDGVQTLPLEIDSELTSRLDYKEFVLEEKPVGEGTYGVVYRGTWRGLNVAYKKLKTQFMTKVEIDEFYRESALLEKLRSPYIVSYVGSVFTKGEFAIATEFLPLGSVKALLGSDNKKIKSKTIKARIVHDAAHALCFLHQNNIIHRDVKNDNLLVCSLSRHADVNAKLTDFGTSRSTSASNQSEMTIGVGTPAFMAPEILDNKHYSKSADVYSFAMLMLELWTAKTLYPISRFPRAWGKKLTKKTKLTTHTIFTFIYYYYYCYLFIIIYFIFCRRL